VDEEHVGDVVDAEAGVAIEFGGYCRKMNVQRDPMLGSVKVKSRNRP
jgi:hypothetical protein